MLRSWLIAAGMLALLSPVGACGGAGQFVVTGTERSVGVDGVIEIVRQQEDINVIDVVLINLPPPERHEKGRKHFVVWLTPKDGQPIRAGRLSYDPDARRGTLRATTPNDQVFVQVTAESTSRINQPSDFVVISRHVSLKGEATANAEEL